MPINGAQHLTNTSISQREGFEHFYVYPSAKKGAKSFYKSSHSSTRQSSMSYKFQQASHHEELMPKPHMALHIPHLASHPENPPRNWKEILRLSSLTSRHMI